MWELVVPLVTAAVGAVMLAVVAHQRRKTPATTYEYSIRLPFIVRDYGHRAIVIPLWMDWDAVLWWPVTELECDRDLREE